MVMLFDDVKWMCPIVPKCGLSSLGAVFYKKTTGKDLDAGEVVWNNIAPILLKDKPYPRCRRYKSFVVYRDPVDRFISLYTDIMTNDVSFHLTFLRNAMGYKIDPVEARRQLLEDVGLFVDKGLELAARHADGHMNTQRYLLAREGYVDMHGIDVIVKINDLDAFIKNELKADNHTIRRNVSRSGIDKSIFNPYRDRIREFYKNDYELFEKNQKKVYIPPKKVDIDYTSKLFDDFWFAFRFLFNTAYIIFVKIRRFIYPNRVY